MKALIFSDLAAGILETLGGRFPGVAFHPCTSYAALGPALAQLQPEIVVAGRFEAAPFPRDMLLTCPSLRWLSLTSAGVDHVVPFDAGRITVTNAAGVAAEEMAQYVIAAIFGLYQGFPRFARQQDAQLWKFDLIRSARGASVGIVGLGRTGAAIARLCKAVGLRVLACRSRPLPSPHVDQLYATADLKEMLAACDVTVLCAALTPETRDMFDAETFASLRPGSYFINVGRGALVDEDALVAALESGHLAGDSSMWHAASPCRRAISCGRRPTCSSRRIHAASFWAGSGARPRCLPITSRVICLVRRWKTSSRRSVGIKERDHVGGTGWEAGGCRGRQPWDWPVDRTGLRRGGGRCLDLRARHGPADGGA
jgi:phosphoglycerate dehydrogenase-like enzyme